MSGQAGPLDVTVGLRRFPAEPGYEGETDLAAGMRLQFGPKRWYLRPAVAWSSTVVVFYGGAQIEVSLGVIGGRFHPKGVNVWWGTGGALVRDARMGGTQTSAAGYLTGGVGWLTGTGRVLGLEVKYLKGGDRRVVGRSYAQIEYLQVGLVVGLGLSRWPEASVTTPDAPVIRPTGHR